MGVGMFESQPNWSAHDFGKHDEYSVSVSSPVYIYIQWNEFETTSHVRIVGLTRTRYRTQNIKFTRWPPHWLGYDGGKPPIKNKFRFWKYIRGINCVITVSRLWYDGARGSYRFHRTAVHHTGILLWNLLNGMQRIFF